MNNQDRRNLKKKSCNPRCEISGKFVGCKPVVLCENAIEYVKKMGYSVEYLVFRKPLNTLELNKRLRMMHKND